MQEETSSEDRRWCSVPQCPFRPWHGSSFHRFPSKDSKLREKWRTALCIKKRISPFMVVCSNHFRKENFFPQRIGQKLRFLKPGSIPSHNLPRQSTDSALLPSQLENVNQSRRTRRSYRLSKIQAENNGLKDVTEDIAQATSPRVAETSTKSEPRSTSVKRSRDEVGPLDYAFGDQKCEHGEPFVDKDFPGLKNKHDEDAVIAMILRDILNNSMSREEKKICKEAVSSLIKMPTRSRSLLKVLSSNLEMKAFTGIRLELLDSLADAVTPYKDQCLKHACSLKERVVLTMCKLRLNSSFFCLGLLFSVNSQTCKILFSETLGVLESVLSGAVYWPTKESILKTMPSCFREYFQTRVVMDLIEVVTEKPKCLKCCSSLHSEAKGSETVKILIGVAPSGLITYISKPYAGHFSNDAIIKHTNLLDLLANGEDCLMVSKELHIQDECAQRGLRLICPPPLSNKSMLSKEDALTSMRIAAARVHVAEALQRIKKFKILSSVLQHSLLPNMNAIFVVIAAVVNLSSSALSNEQI